MLLFRLLQFCLLKLNYNVILSILFSLVNALQFNKQLIVVRVMDRLAKPKEFDVAPNTAQCGKKFKLWIRGFNYFLSTINPELNPDKLELLFLHIGPDVVDIIQDAKTFEEAVKLLEDTYVKPPNEIYARHLLSTRYQRGEENLDEFLQSLLTLAHDCNFKAVSAEENKSSFVRDSFIRSDELNQIPSGHGF